MDNEQAIQSENNKKYRQLLILEQAKKVLKNIILLLFCLFRQEIKALYGIYKNYYFLLM
jgi:hypothetical protein